VSNADHPDKEPAMPSIATLAPTLQQHLTVTANEAAQACGCVQRVRQFNGATLVQTLVLGFLEAPDASLSELCQFAALRGVHITPQGLAQRFTPALARTLQQVLTRMVADVVRGPAVAIPLLQRFGHVWVLDTTTISLPDDLAELWAGCGGNAGQGQAALKVAIELDLVSGQLAGPLLQAGRAPDRSSPLCTTAHPAGTLCLRDLGFFRLASFQAASSRGEAWLSRLMAGTILFTSDGQRWTQPALLASQADTPLDLPVELGATARIPARLLAARVPAMIAQTRRERLQREAIKKGQPVSADRLALAEWTILVTNLSTEDLSLDEALALIRARWQIEQLFDLWKTHGGLDRSRSTQPWRVLAELYAKLIALLIQHWLILHGDWSAPGHSLPKAARIVRRTARWIAVAIDRIGRLRAILRDLRAMLLHAGRLNPRKRHPNTYQRLLDPGGTCLT
jgi:hypothetical protein